MRFYYTRDVAAEYLELPNLLFLSKTTRMPTGLTLGDRF